MNVKRFTARTSRDALGLVRQSLGDDAVVLSTKPCAEGVEVLAMAPDSLQQMEHFAQPAAAAPQRALSAATLPAATPRQAPARAEPAADWLSGRDGVAAPKQSHGRWSEKKVLSPL